MTLFGWISLVSLALAAPPIRYVDASAFADPNLRTVQRQPLAWTTLRTATAWTDGTSLLVTGLPEGACAMALSGVLPPGGAEAWAVGLWWSPSVGMPTLDALQGLAEGEICRDTLSVVRGETPSSDVLQTAIRVAGEAARASNRTVVVDVDLSGVLPSVWFPDDAPNWSLPDGVEAPEGFAFDAGRAVAARMSAREAAQRLSVPMPSRVEWPAGSEDATLYAAMRDPERIDEIRRQQRRARRMLDDLAEISARLSALDVLDSVDADTLRARTAWLEATTTSAGRVLTSLDALLARVEALPDSPQGPPFKLRFEKSVFGPAPSWLIELEGSDVDVGAALSVDGLVRLAPQSVLEARQRNLYVSTGDAIADRTAADLLDRYAQQVANSLTDAHKRVGELGPMTVVAEHDGAYVPAIVLQDRVFVRVDPDGTVGVRSVRAEAVEPKRVPGEGHYRFAQGFGLDTVVALTEAPASVGIPLAASARVLQSLDPRWLRPAEVVAWGSAALVLHGDVLEHDLGGIRTLMRWRADHAGRFDRAWRSLPVRALSRLVVERGILPSDILVTGRPNAWSYDLKTGDGWVNICRWVICEDGVTD